MAGATESPPPVVAPDATATAALWAALLPYLLPALKPALLMLAGALFAGLGHMAGQPAVSISSDLAPTVDAAIDEHRAEGHPEAATSVEVAELRDSVEGLTDQMDTVLYVVCRSAAKQGIETAECRGR